jgi:hypothetical protein
VSLFPVEGYGVEVYETDMNQWHHFDPSGTAQVITNNSAGVVGNNLYDVFGVLRHPQGVAQTPWRWVWKTSADEAMLFGSRGFWLPERGINIAIQPLAIHVGAIIAVCGLVCVIAGLELWDHWDDCQKECAESITPVTCWGRCILKICGDNALNAVACATCACCIAGFVRLPFAAQLCKWLGKKLADKIPF